MLCHNVYLQIILPMKRPLCNEFIAQKRTLFSLLQIFMKVISRYIYF